MEEDEGGGEEKKEEEEVTLKFSLHVSECPMVKIWN
jgi:hypothetical protein